MVWRSIYFPGILTERRDQAILSRVHYLILEGRMQMEEQTGTDRSFNLVMHARITWTVILLFSSVRLCGVDGRLHSINKWRYTKFLVICNMFISINVKSTSRFPWFITLLPSGWLSNGTLGKKCISTKYMSKRNK